MRLDLILRARGTDRLKYTSKGAEASATIYSIIETAKANALDPYLYLEYLFEHLPGLPVNRRPELLDRLMPWMPKIQEACGKGKSRDPIC